LLTLESVAPLGSVVPLVSVGCVHGVMCCTVRDGEMILVASTVALSGERYTQVP
jgi:hypothetical protein